MYGRVDYFDILTKLCIGLMLFGLGLGIATESDKISKKLDAVCGPVAEQPQPTR